MCWKRELNEILVPEREQIGGKIDGWQCVKGFPVISKPHASESYVIIHIELLGFG